MDGLIGKASGRASILVFPFWRRWQRSGKGGGKEDCSVQQCSAQMHTTASLSRFTNCAPNTRVLTSQGSWIEIESFLAVLLEATLTLNVPLVTQLPEMHPFSDIQY